MDASFCGGACNSFSALEKEECAVEYAGRNVCLYAALLMKFVVLFLSGYVII